MKEAFLIFILFITVCRSVSGQEKKVCLTIDDLPVVIYDGQRSGVGAETLTSDIVDFLTVRKIPAVGFVNEKKLIREGNIDPAAVELLEYWLQNRLELANHTFRHLNYHRTDFDTFALDILNGEKISRPLSRRYDMPYRYFRFPFLNIGKTKEEADTMRQFLRLHAYIEAPVTIDNSDYIFAELYEKALAEKDTAEMRRIGSAYLRLTADRIDYSEKLSEMLFHRQISQVFLIHMNRLNADYLEDLYTLLRERSYAFVTLEQALTDDAYSQPVTRYGDWGISWLERWAMSQNTGKELMRAVPEAETYLEE